MDRFKQLEDSMLLEPHPRKIIGLLSAFLKKRALWDSIYGTPQNFNVCYQDGGKMTHNK